MTRTSSRQITQQLEFDFKIRQKRHFTFKDSNWHVSRLDGIKLGFGRTLAAANSWADMVEDIFDKDAEERMKPISSMPLPGYPLFVDSRYPEDP